MRRLVAIAVNPLEYLAYSTSTQIFRACQFAATQGNSMISGGIGLRGVGDFAATMQRDPQPFSSEGRNLNDCWAAGRRIS